MAFTYRLAPLPSQWPGKRSTSTKKSPFKTQWTRTVKILEREIRHLQGTNVEIAIDVRSERDIRADGLLRADARPRHPVILSFTVPATYRYEAERQIVDMPERRLQFPCDTYGWWEDNVYAIASALENLRAVERWGVSRTSQYEGFRAIPATTGVTLSTQDASALIARHADVPVTVVSDFPSAQIAVRIAARRTHPDSGGSASDFQLVQEAKRVLEAHFGSAL